MSKDTPAKSVDPVIIEQTTTHTSHHKRTTTSVITDTAHILHERAPEEGGPLLTVQHDRPDQSWFQVVNQVLAPS